MSEVMVGIKRSSSSPEPVNDELDHDNSNGNDLDLDLDQPERKKRRSRKGLKKQYECEEPSCGKKFTRLEHLSRHQLNHRPKEIFKCTWDGCERTFVREDLRQRHLERHEKRQSTGPIRRTSRSESQQGATNGGDENGTADGLTNTLSQQSMNVDGIDLDTATEASPTELISWLFSEDMLSNAKEPILSPSIPFDSPMSWHNLLSPPSSIEESTLSEWKRKELLAIVPIEHGCATLSSFQRYIANFWAYIHPQYPILHKPSFQADACPGGLLWSMLILGAAIDKRQDFTVQVSETLRWYLFGSSDFHPPTKLWVIQALVLLELYEKTMSNRKEHERAHIHHGTTLQLLRRSAVLRGMESPREADPWKRWIEVEAAKRVALMAFVLDVFDATMFGHSMVMSVHEIRLSLPCSESIWAEFPSEKGIPRIHSEPFLTALKKLLNKTHVDTGPFGRRVLLGGLLCISHQMQQRDLQVSSLGWGHFKDTWRDVLGPAYNFWKHDYDTSLKDDVPETTSFKMELQGCTSSFYHLAHTSMMVTFLDAQIYAGCPTQLNQPIRQVDHEMSVRRVNEWAMSQYGRIAYWHSVQFLREMYLAVNHKSSSLYLAKCNCPNPRSRAASEQPEDGTLLPAKCDLSDTIKLEYDAYTDVVGKRPNAVYLCGLMVWAFGYCLEGPESTVLAESVSSVEQELRNASRNPHNDDPKRELDPDEAIDRIEGELSHISSAEPGHEYLHRLSQYTPQELVNVQNRHQTVGLLRMICKSLKYHPAELVQEGRRLLTHCIDRSLGRNKLQCEYMFPKQKN